MRTIENRPLGWLIFGWIGGLAIGFSVGRLLFGRWLWDVNPFVAVLDAALTIIFLTLFWWWLWRPKS